MIDFYTAFLAKLPFIGIHTDDPVNVKEALTRWSKKALHPMPKTVTAGGESYLWWSDSLDPVTTENYRKMMDSESSCVIINPEKASMLVFDVGTLPTPESMYEDYLKEFVETAFIPVLVAALRGLSLKVAQEVVQITMARTGSLLPKDIRKTRQMMSESHPGLTVLETDYDFYEWPKELKEWLDLNDSYFMCPQTPQQLVPRGLLLTGDPGTGKSMSAMVLARHWDVPLLRLDVPSSLNRYLGTSEARISTSLGLIEQSAPCIWLLDEAEKLFGTGGDEGTTQRILSQLLWWLQYHRGRVLTIMTTNNLEALPKELYRSERVDRVIHTERLPLSAAKLFAARVYESVVKKPLPMKRQKVLRDSMDKADKGTWAHAEARVLTYEAIKTNGWLLEEK